MNHYRVKEAMTVKLRGADVFAAPLFVGLPSVIVVGLCFTRSDVTIVRIFPRSGREGAFDSLFNVSGQRIPDLSLE
jgi:hypothetical protein